MNGNFRNNNFAVKMNHKNEDTNEVGHDFHGGLFKIDDI